MPSDPFQMAMIHRTFRTEFGNLPGLIRTVAQGDTKRSKLVGDYLGNMILVLEHHHAAEDEVLWPKLRVRTSRGAIEIERAEGEHVHIAELIDKVQSVRPSWTGSAYLRLAEQLSAAVDDLSADANEHFDHEDRYSTSHRRIHHAQGVEGFLHRSRCGLRQPTEPVVCAGIRRLPAAGRDTRRADAFHRRSALRTANVYCYSRRACLRHLPDKTVRRFRIGNPHPLSEQ